MKFADLHCHAHIRSYLWLRPDREKFEEKDQYNPWTVVASNMPRLRRAVRASGYGQCDTAVLWNSNFRLVFTSLYPFEQGFFRTSKKSSEGGNQLLKNLAKAAMGNSLPFRAWVQGVYMRIPMGTVKEIRSKDYDYWEVLQDEYKFVCNGANRKFQSEVFLPGLPRQIFENKKRQRRRNPQRLDAEGIYYIPKNKAELKKYLQSEEKALTWILTIEGGHAFGGEGVDFATKQERLRYLKNDWEYPLFFITYAHHFNNFLCGHAPSFPNIAKYVLNQDSGLNEGFSQEGWLLLRQLLALDENNEPCPEHGYRVLIDVKHMSALARQEYYEQIIYPCLEKGDKIPVIASHCGYAGVPTLQQLLDDTHKENDEHRVKNDYGTFYACGINMSDEDIHAIFKSGGLYGLSFDRRIMGVSSSRVEEKEEQLDGIGALWGNLKAVLQVICKGADKQTCQKAWGMVTIGTDFDGYIEPLTKYATALEFSKVVEDMYEAIRKDVNSENPPECVACFDEEFTIELATQQVYYTNAERFVLEYYPDK